jgi:ferredoxin
MNSQLIYFSPTHTTQKILRAITETLGMDKKPDIDLTSKKNRENFKENHHEVEGDVIILGLPVYGQKPPALLIPFINKIDGAGKKLVIVGVYGNVKTNDFLKYTWNLLKINHFELVAMGEFIGEHSFIYEDLPLAKGRPDSEDLNKAKDFGQKIKKKIKDLNQGKANILELKTMELPNTYTSNWISDSTPSADPDKNLCAECGICVDSCPTEAISLENLMVDRKNCIGCFACVKSCPHQARTNIITNSAVLQKMQSFIEPRQEPKIFL